MKHAKFLADPAVIEATNGADKFFIQDGATTISGFGHDDRLLFVGNSYSDILYLGKLYDGWSMDTITGVHFEAHSLDVNGDGVMDTQIVGSDSIVNLLSVDLDSLYGWQIMGG